MFTYLLKQISPFCMEVLSGRLSDFLSETSEVCWNSKTNQYKNEQNKSHMAWKLPCHIFCRIKKGRVVSKRPIQAKANES